MVKRLREEWEKYHRGSKLQLVWNDDKTPVGPDKHPGLFSESIGVLMAKAHIYDWKKGWEEQDETKQEILWTELKKVWELDENRKEVTLGRIANNVFKNKKCKWKKRHYACHTTYEERVIDKPEQLTAQEWIALVEFWDTRPHIM
ncbi:hypothetical protein ACHQM5_016870 [Ranunculus cassubicifolius]